jgi:hypothetical protein
MSTRLSNAWESVNERLHNSRGTKQSEAVVPLTLLPLTPQLKYSGRRPCHLMSASWSNRSSSVISAQVGSSSFEIASVSMLSMSDMSCWSLRPRWNDCAAQSTAASHRRTHSEARSGHSVLLRLRVDAGAGSASGIAGATSSPHADRTKRSSASTRSLTSTASAISCGQPSRVTPSADCI